MVCRGLASAERVFTLVDRVPRVRLSEGIEPTETVVGDVEFCDVWFQYDGRDKVRWINSLVFFAWGQGRVGKIAFVVAIQALKCGDVVLGLQTCVGFRTWVNFAPQFSYSI